MHVRSRQRVTNADAVIFAFAKRNKCPACIAKTMHFNAYLLSPAPPRSKTTTGDEKSTRAVERQQTSPFSSLSQRLEQPR